MARSVLIIPELSATYSGGKLPPDRALFLAYRTAGMEQSEEVRIILSLCQPTGQGLKRDPFCARVSRQKGLKRKARS